MFKKKKPCKPQGKREYHFQRNNIIRFKCPFCNKNHKAYEETGMDGPFKGKKNQEKLFLKKGLLEDILGKDFKTIVIKMLKELKEDVEKVKKMMNIQNGISGKRWKTEKGSRKKFWS